MSGIFSFGGVTFDSSEVLKISGFIEYPYIKIARLRSYTTVQIGAKTTEVIEVRVLLTPEKFKDLDFNAAIASRRLLNFAGREWGRFRIESIARSIRFDGQMEVTVVFGQVFPAVAIADFKPVPDPVGKFGLFELGRSELLHPIKVKLDYPTAILARLQNYPKIQDAGDDLMEVSLALKFNEQYNIDPTPLERLLTAKALGDTYSFYTLTIKGVTYGDFVLKRIAWEMRQLGLSRAITLDCNLDLLQSPNLVPPRLPKIFSFLLNGVEQVTALAPFLTSVTFQDLMDGGTTLLELEFDAEATGLPKEGDTIRLWFGYDQEGRLPNTNLVDTGLHRCDRPVRRYTPDTVSIGSQSYDYNLAINSQQRITFTSATLATIVSNIASAFNLGFSSNASVTVFAGTSPDTTSNVSVSADSYFELLQQLAQDYGYAFQLRYGTLFFRSFDSLSAVSYVFGLTPSDCLSTEFISKVKGTYRTAIFPHKTGAVTSVDTTIPNNDGLDFRPSPFYHNQESALQRSIGELSKYNRSKLEATITIEGRFNAFASVNIQLVSFRENTDNGYFRITAATHKITATSGWTTELKLQKIF